MRQLRMIIALAIITSISCKNEPPKQDNRAEIEKAIFDSLALIKQQEEEAAYQLEMMAARTQQHETIQCNDKVDELNNILSNNDTYRKTCDNTGITGYFRNEYGDGGSKMIIPFEDIDGIKLAVYGGDSPTTLVLAYGKWVIVERFSYLIGSKYGAGNSEETKKKFEQENKAKTDARMNEVVTLIKDIVQCKTGRSI